MPKYRIFNIANMSFNDIRENKVLAKNLVLLNKCYALIIPPTPVSCILYENGLYAVKISVR